jgi:hypothetical protein
LALSTDKEGILKLASEGHDVQQPEDLFKKEEATEGDNEPVGIVLGAYKDHVLVEYATSGITNKVLLAKYQLYLPDKAQLESALNSVLNVTPIA